ncbi:MAG: flagellar basal body P-ring formation chaperone FlgA [Planctomycetota bacterium]|jgi:flagella basal body P-ring formation protein FlgA
MKNHTRPRTRRWPGIVYFVAIVAAGALARASLGDEISLKGSVRLKAAAEAVRLADIAELSGPDAQLLADTVIAEAPGDTVALEITVRQVRAKLADAGAHWGRIQLNGRTVIVRPAAPRAAAPPLTMTPVAVQPPAEPKHKGPPAPPHELAADLVDLTTLRGTVARMFVDALSISPQKLRFVFDDRSAALLDTHQDSLRFEIQPLGSLAADRVELAVRAWSEGRIEQRHSITVGPTVNIDVAVLRRDISRGQEIREEDLEVEARWLAPSQAALMSSLVQAVGRVASMRLKEGDPLRARHIQREHVIKRGDRVMVRCLVGGVVISLEAEARTEGAKGDRIELRKLGERDTFMATATGPGAAVIDLSRQEPTT